MTEAKVPIQQKQEAYVFKYPEFATLADQQLKIFWPWNEIKVEKDKQDLLVGMTESEYHAVVTALKLFTKYELFVGNEYWLDRVMKNFPRPEIQRMAACFGHVELNSHAPFYNRINEELGLATEEFYNSYVNDPVLKDRMDFIDSLVSHEDDAISLAGFSMIEGAVLYSSFAFLKHFQSQGKNKMSNVCRGINMSVRDENLHSVGGAELFKQLVKERKLSTEQVKDLETTIRELAKVVCEHEKRIVAMLFEKGKIEGITSTQMEHFVESRVNTCLEQLGYKKEYDVKYNPIADWFYDGINNFMMNDFFQGIGREYARGWDSTSFVWKGCNGLPV